MGLNSLCHELEALPIKLLWGGRAGGVIYSRHCPSESK